MIPNEYNEGNLNYTPSTEIKVFMEEFWAILYNVVNELDRIKQNYRTKAIDFATLEDEVRTLRKELSDATESVEALNIYVSDYKAKDGELDEAFLVINELRQQHTVDFELLETLKQQMSSLQADSMQHQVSIDAKTEQLVTISEEKNILEEQVLFLQHRLVSFQDVENQLRSTELKHTEETQKLQERITFLETIHSDLQKTIDTKEQQLLEITEEKEFIEQLFKEEQQNSTQQFQSISVTEKQVREERDFLKTSLADIELRYSQQADEFNLDRLQKENEKTKLLATIETLKTNEEQLKSMVTDLESKLSTVVGDFEDFKVRNTQEIVTLTEHKQLYEQLDQELEERLESERILFKKKEEELLEQVLNFEAKEDALVKQVQQQQQILTQYTEKLQDFERVNLLLTDKRELLESQIESMQQMVAEQTKQLEQATNRTKLMEEYSQQLQSKTTSLEVKIEEQQQLIDSKYHSSAESAEHIASLRGELDIFKADNVQLRERSESYYRDVERSRSEIASLNQAVEILTRQIQTETSSKEEIEKQLLEVKILNNQLEEAQIMVSSEFQMTIAQQEMELSQLQDQMDRLNNEQESMVPYEIVLGYQQQISRLEEEVANSPQQYEMKSKENEEEITRLNNEKAQLHTKTEQLEQTIKTLQSKLDDVSNVAQLSELLKIQLEEKEQELDALNERLHLSEVALSMAQTQAALSKDQSENMNDFSAIIQSQQEKFLTLQDEIETIKESRAQLDEQPSVQDEELISKMKDMFDKL